MDAFLGFFAKLLVLAVVAFMYWEWYDEAQKKKAAKKAPKVEVNDVQDEHRMEQTD